MLSDDCAYQLVATRPGGGVDLTDLSDSCTGLQWDRKDSTTTVGTATLQKRAGRSQPTITGEADVAPDCCSKIAGLATVAQEFEVRRGGTVVWAGPLSVIDEGRSDVQLKASDESAWIRDWRTLARSYTAPVDVAHANAPTRDLDDVWHDVAALALQGPQTGLVVGAGAAVGVKAARAILAGKRTAGSDIDELTRTGRPWTMVGRTLIFDAASRTAIQLVEDDFVSELRVVENGEQWGSRVWLNGNGNVQAVAGGVSTGGVLKDVIVNETTIMDQASAQQGAQRRWQAGGGDYPVPTVVVPNGAELAGTAQVDINDLIPGCSVGIRLTSFCSTKVALATFVLSDVTVKVAGAQGAVTESVAVTFAATTLVDQGAT